MFDYTEWRKEENHLKYVRDEEKKADSENSEDGYELNPESTLTLVSTVESEAAVSS